MRSWRSPNIFRPIPRNVLFYDGPSQLTGDRILAIATAQNGNRKIGHMLQVWVVPAESPLEAVRTGRDQAVCGDCRLRGRGLKQRTCYVYLPGVDNIWQARGKAIRETPAAFARRVAGVPLRLGAYGDPVAVPMAVWLELLGNGATWTAYTHAWRRPTAQPYRAFVMASVDSRAEQLEAVALGWRTFRVRATADPLLEDEVVCPASEEADHKAICQTCNLCRGLSRPAKSVAIVVHGHSAKWFSSRPAAIAAAGGGVLR
jgi:hypothetical protein